MKNLSFILLVAMLTFSCNFSVNKIFAKRTPHESYANKVEDTKEGLQWVFASEKALNEPHTIQLPYRQHGYFHTDKPRALAIQFTAKRGERINFDLTKKPGTNFVIYADLFKKDGERASHLIAADTAESQFGFDVDEPGIYTLRLQPQLYRTGEYSLSVSVGSSLGFPVVGDKASTGSFWGDARDGGQRSHEGIDIFAPKLTPVVAAADGFITSVRDEGLGGKTVWLRVSNRNISLYYAHLNKQLVNEGQYVKKGDVIGLVGNTGNARLTSPHLHFGIYTFGGAVDPFPFVNKTIKIAPAIPTKNLRDYLKLIKSQSGGKNGLTKSNTLLIPLAVTSKGYIAELPDGNIMETPFASVKTVKLEKQQAEILPTGSASSGSIDNGD